jgi:hypothetical protein
MQAQSFALCLIYTIRRQRTTARKAPSQITKLSKLYCPSESGGRLMEYKVTVERRRPVQKHTLIVL